MRILIDIVHPADINFYKNAIRILKERGNEIFITYMDRGKVEAILKKEYKEFKVSLTKIGRHYSNKYKKIFGMFERVSKLVKYMYKKDFDVVTGFQGFYIAVAAKFYKIPSIVFYDDYEYKLMFNLCKLFSTKFIIPKSIPVTGKNVIKGFNFKELAYLHPNYFKPNKSALKKYKVESKKYVFIREISNISLNYYKDSYDLDSIIKKIKKRDLKILLSLEDKSLAKKYSKDCIILKEPVEGIYSLIYYSKFVISSGDTIPREAALLGVPAFYIGNRDMKINKSLVKKRLISNTFDVSSVQTTKKSYFDNTWIDTTKTIVRSF